MIQQNCTMLPKALQYIPERSGILYTSTSPVCLRRKIEEVEFLKALSYQTLKSWIT